jgi:hypothetical protein
MLYRQLHSSLVWLPGNSIQLGRMLLILSVEVAGF